MKPLNFADAKSYYDLALHQTSRLLTTLKKKPFENIVGKGGNAGNQYFLLLQQ